MKSFIKRTGAVWLSALLAFPQGFVLSTAAAEAGKTGNGAVSMDGLSVADDQVRITLSGPVKYRTFETANPPRLVVELLNTEHKVGIKSLAGKGRYLMRVRAGQFETVPKMISRVVLDLASEADFSISGAGDALVVSLSPRAAQETAAAPLPRPTVKASAPAAKPAPVAASASMALPASGGIPAMGTKSSPELSRMAKGHSVIGSRGGKVRSRVQRRKELAEKLRKSHRGSPRRDIMDSLPSDKVTLDFDNTDIRDVLRLMASKAKVNIIHGADVGGTLTLHLADVPFDEAFRTILSMKDLTTLQVGGNVLRIITPDALTEMRNKSTGVTKVIPLNYVEAKDILNSINQVRTAEGRSKGMALADEKTNSLIVTDTLGGIAATQRLIAQLDVKPIQVMIEAKLIEVGLNRGLHYGVEWDYFQQESGKAFGKLGETYIGAAPVPSSNPPVKPFNEDSVEVKGTFPAGGKGRGTGVNLPASSIFGALTLGRVTNNFFLNATLTAAASKGKVKVLSDPKIATLNNKNASIKVTTSIPYVTSNVSSTGVATESVTYVETGITLEVTPTVNADGRITLKIKPEVSQPSATAAASTTGAPAIDSRKADTIVLVDDGETIVIGGLISDTVNTTISKVPLLGDIPILGWLFKKKSVTRSRGELLIFVTPKIVD